MIDLGEKVKQRRIELGLSQKQLGKALGVPQQTIYSYEQNNPRTLIKIMDQLSEVLKFDFRKYYEESDSSRMVEEEPAEYIPSNQKVYRLVIEGNDIISIMQETRTEKENQARLTRIEQQLEEILARDIGGTRNKNPNS